MSISKDTVLSLSILSAFFLMLLALLEIVIEMQITDLGITLFFSGVLVTIAVICAIKKEKENNGKEK